MAPRAQEPTVFCSECRIHYPNYMSYDAHRKRKMEAGEGHIHCETCSAEFTHMDTLGRHTKQEHPREQDLNCPGCGLHFTRLGGLMNHIESNQCLKIPKAEIEEERLKRSYMSKELAKAGKHDPKEFFGRFPGMGSITAMAPGQHYLGYIKSGGSNNPMEKAPEGSNLSTKAPTSQAQACRHPGLRSGSLDTTEFPTPAGAAASKNLFGGERIGASANESGPNVSSSAHPSASVCSEESSKELPLGNAKTLSDSRWAPDKGMTASPLPCRDQSRQIQLHPIYDRDILNKRLENDQAKCVDLSRQTKQSAISIAIAHEDAQEQPSSQQRATNEALAEQTDTVPDKGKPIGTHGRSLHAGESSVGPIGESEVTSHFSAASEDTAGCSSAFPPHLRVKSLRQEATISGQASIGYDDHQSARMLPPHLQSGLDAGLITAAKTEALDGENDTSTTKHSGQGTMGLLPISSRGGRSASALPPHLRIKMNEKLKAIEGGAINTESPDGGVRLERQEKGKLGLVPLTEATTTQLDSKLSMPTERGTIVDPNSRSDVEQTQPSLSGEALANTGGGSGLPPHLRVKPGLGVVVSPARPAEAGYNPNPNMSTGQSRPGESEMGQLPTTRDNFGVVESVKSHVVVAKDDRALAPHLRTKQPRDGALPIDQNSAKDAVTEMAPESHPLGSRDATTQTGDVAEILRDVTLRPTDTSMDAVSTMNPEDEGVGLGPHDPGHPMYDARNYRSPYTGRFHCPIPNCGKGFKSMQGITGHLASDVHRRPLMRLQCPHCLRYFNSVTALTQHSESEGRKCEIRNTNEFRHFLDHLTAGLADVDGKHDDQTNRYIVPEIAQTKYGGDEVERRMRNALEQEEARQREEKGGSFHDGKSIHW